MGIQGLTTFVANNSKNLLENYSLKDCVIVIDGNSLCIQLFQNECKSNKAFGGDYNIYRKAVMKFFENLSKCNITPYVVFDGGYEENKLKTVLKRLRCRIVDAQKINPSNQYSFLVLPLLLKDVFIEVLSSLKVKFLFCDYEADQEIAIIARNLDCPVLSYDSDFYIYNVKYIPYPTIIHKVAVHKKDNATSYYLKCKIYRVEKFLNFYNIDVNVLPLVATLLGNDYVKRSVFSKFFHNLSESKSKRKNAGQCRISALIHWFKNETFDSALEKILNRFKLLQRRSILNKINKSCAVYSTKFCNSLKYFGLQNEMLDNENSKDTTHQNLVFDNLLENQEQPICSVEEENCSDTSSECESNQSDDSLCDDFIPYEVNDSSSEGPNDWVKELLRFGKISSKFYDLINISVYIGSPQVEDTLKPDSYLSAMPILKFSFNIVMNFKSSLKIVYEGRRVLSHRRIEIDLENINDVDKYWTNRDEQPGAELFYYFLERTIIGNQINDILGMPNEIQMIVLTIIWITNSDVEHVAPTESYVSAIVLCYIAMLLLNTHSVKECTVFEFQSKYSKNFKKWYLDAKNTPDYCDKTFGDLYENLTYYADSMLAINELLKYFNFNQNLVSSPKQFKREHLHFFAEYQSCLQQLGYLNTLCSEPFSPCVYGKTYNGTFIYNMYDNLRRRTNVLTYVSQLLNKSPKVLSFYLKIMQFFGYSVDAISSEQKISKKIKKKKNSNIVNTENDCEKSVESSEESDNLCDVNNKFYLLNVAS